MEIMCAFVRTTRRASGATVQRNDSPNIEWKNKAEEENLNITVDFQFEEHFEPESNFV